MSLDERQFTVIWWERDADYCRHHDADDAALGAELFAALTEVCEQPRFDALFPYRS